MNRSRRGFLGTGGMMGLAALFTGRLAGTVLGQNGQEGLGTGIGNPVPKAALLDPLAQITRAMFTQSLNTKFSFSLGRVYLADLALVDIKVLNPPFVKGNATSTRECFALIFRGPTKLPLGQRTYTVTHKTLGTFELFIVPGNITASGGPHYEALINRAYP